MKATVFVILFWFLWINVIAQAPQSFSYQAVVRDNTGGILVNKTVSFKISILNGSSSGMLVYSESHKDKKTNDFGLVNIEIGKGTPETGIFYFINWALGNYFVKVEIMPEGATTYQEMGTSQLLSVPYALYAREVEINNDADTDPVNEIQTLSVTGTNLTLSKGGGTVPFSRDNWGTQVARTNNTLTGQGTESSPLGVVSSAINPVWSNIQSIPSGFADGTDNVDDADADVNNEIQVLSKIGNIVTLSKNGGSFTDAVDDADADAANEIQVLTRSGNLVSLSKNGGSFTDATDDADADPSNELQELQLTGTVLGLTKSAKTVTLPSSGGGDNWGTQIVKTTSALTGQGTDSNPLGVANTVITPFWYNILNVPAGFADGIDNINYADTSSTNELQTLSISGTLLTLSGGGGTVTLPSSGGGDNWGTQAVKTNSTLTGQGTDASPLGIIQSQLRPSWNNIEGIPAGFADGLDNTGSGGTDSTNEIQTLSLASNQLTISGAGGNSVTFTNWDTDETNDVRLSGNQTIAGNKTFTGTISAGNNNIIDVGNPVNARDAATKAYVDALLQRIKGLESQLGIVTDNDGKVYKTVKIGNQEWMAENLAWLPAVSPPTIKSDTEPQYYVYDYNGTSVAAAKATANYNTYGVLYNWAAAMGGAAGSTASPGNVQGACPAGWHLPGDTDWKTLSDYLTNNGFGYNGNGDDIAKSLAAKTNWSASIGAGSPGNDPASNNSSGFSALPGGHFGNTFFFITGDGFWWSSTENSVSDAWYRCLFNYSAYQERGFVTKKAGLSIRCVRD